MAKGGSVREKTQEQREAESREDVVAAKASARAAAEGRLRGLVNAGMELPIARVVQQAFMYAGQRRSEVVADEVRDAVTILTEQPLSPFEDGAAPFNLFDGEYQPYPTDALPQWVIDSVEFEAVWQAIKDWDIEREKGSGYASANGTAVGIILNALHLPGVRRRERPFELEENVTVVDSGQTLGMHIGVPVKLARKLLDHVTYEQGDEDMDLIVAELNDLLAKADAAEAAEVGGGSSNSSSGN